MIRQTCLYNLPQPFGAQIMQVHIGTYFGNPEDITIVGKLPEFEPITLEKHVIYDTLNFEWQNL